jgi:hypothetical protein
MPATDVGNYVFGKRGINSDQLAVTSDTKSGYDRLLINERSQLEKNKCPKKPI